MSLKSGFLVVIPIILISLCTCSTPKHEPNATNEFVQVQGEQFILKGKPYRFVGTNFWYGAYLGMEGQKGDRERLVKELDLLKANGMTNLRILAASEKANHDRALTPTFLDSSGIINEDLLVGLDYLLAEMGRRDMKAVVILNNFWEWSGGMNVWSEWFGEGKSTIPDETGDWEGFMNFSAKFYRNERAQAAFRDYIKALITRKNSITGLAYNDDPTVMSWQLANEPRPGAGEEGLANVSAWKAWIERTSAYIKGLAPKQLVSTGNEGRFGSMASGENYLDAHRTPNVDYLTFHVWAKNWGWFDANDMEGTFPSAMENAKAYIDEHVEYARQLGKPIVMSEFGLGRDHERFDIGSSVNYRDRYFSFVFESLENHMTNGAPIAGSNIWSWGGFGQPQHADAKWRPGDPFVGDPPQEPQGLNTIYASDNTTLEIIRRHADMVNGDW